ncbi:MAG TPA: hypothetical protein VF992_10725 [Thermoplasmata archaeon]
MKFQLPDFLLRVRKRIRKIPTAYTIGPILFATASGLLIISLTIETAIVGTGFAAGDAGPGISEREVAFRATPLFRASLVTAPCGVEFYLLSDAAYQAYQSDGSLPPSTLDCNRTEALVQYRVGHLVTNYSASPAASNVTFAITVAFLGPRAPYALLSIPGAGLALGVTIWISMTAMARGTDRLLERSRPQYEKRMKK